MQIDRNFIEKNLDKYALDAYGPKFRFRSQQRDVIMDILMSFFDGNCNLYLLEAPTGSGKSIIAMTVAGLLTRFKMKGYILASDLMLQNQYENDFKQHNLQWGSIKGVDNYYCAVNNEKFSLGECRMKNIGYEAAESLDCFQDCGYLFNRKKAINSPVTLLNYSYWLIQRNYVEDKMVAQDKGVPFPKRDFTLCDEAHKIPEIVQNHFSPRFDERVEEKMEKILQMFQRHRLGVINFSISKFKNLMADLRFEDDQKKLFSILKDVESCLLEVAGKGTSVKDHVKMLFPGETVVSSEWKYNMNLMDWCKDIHCKLEDYNHIISQTGIDSMIKNPQGKSLVFNCLDESYMMDKHFHTQAGFKLLMSATLGDPSSFLKTLGASKCKYVRMESTFDYTKSPIYFYPGKRMSLSQRAQNVPWAANKITEILANHKNENGIIHSGSYQITKEIHDLLPPELKRRVLVYESSFFKSDVLERFNTEKGMILMGPSILEGLNLFEDKSRFQIFVKVPFPHLGDRYVSAKMTAQPDWYSWKAIVSILQGIGRSVRSEKDWAVTYFLDGCLSDLLRQSRSSFPEEVQKRIILVK